MKTTFLAASIAALLTAAPALAVEPELGVRLGTGVAEIAAALGQSGYEMTKYEREDGRIEVYAVRDERRVEAYVDVATGQVVAVESRLRAGPWPLPGADDERIRATLEGQGYEIVKYERERDEIEVYAERDGRRWEIEFDTRTGELLSIEEEDR